MAQDALERLYNASNSDDFNYSVEEQMASVNDDDFLESMSEDSRSALMKSVSSGIQEVTLDENQSDNTSIEDESSLSTTDESSVSNIKDTTKNMVNEELFNNKIEDKRLHRQRKVSKPTTENSLVNQNNNNFEPIMNQISLNLINDLQNYKYKISNFDDNLMQIIFNYMRSKF